MKPRSGIIVALSGVESAGKSTQLKHLLDELTAGGSRCVSLWTRPGYTPRIGILKRAIRWLTGKKKDSPDAESQGPGEYPKRASSFRSPMKRWLWLSAGMLELLWIYGVHLRLLQLRGKVVLCDRYLLDCLVDYRTFFPDQRVERSWLGRLLRRFAVKPDASFLLLIPAKESLARNEIRSRHHREKLEVLDTRVMHYRNLAEELEVEIVDGTRSIVEIADDLREGVARVLVGSHKNSRISS